MAWLVTSHLFCTIVGKMAPKNGGPTVRQGGLLLLGRGRASACIDRQEAAAKEGEGLTDVLTELLNGTGRPRTRPPGRTSALPFGRAEIQLSFAPLVKQTAPAVVNVYASQQARRRASPFAGDPFFEQFFGGAGDRRGRSRRSARA